MNVRIAVLMFLIGSIIFSGCASKKISKTAYKELIYSYDWYEYVETYKTPKGNSFTGDILPCFILEESEFKKIFNDIVFECLERELKDAPEIIDLNSSEYKTIQNSTTVCIYTKIVKEIKNDFTFDKSPELVDKCKKIYDNIKAFN